MVRLDQPQACGRGAFSHAVSAHFSSGRGCFGGRGLAKHSCRADRTQLSHSGRVGQRVGCFSWSRSSCLCHSTLYRSCGAVIMSIHLCSATLSVTRSRWTLGEANVDKFLCHCALRAQANFQSKFERSWPKPIHARCRLSARRVAFGVYDRLIARARDREQGGSLSTAALTRNENFTLPRSL